MKKLIAIIIAISSFFSISFITNANEWYLEKVMDLNYGPEEYKLNLEFNKIWYIYFYDSQTNQMYNDFVNANEILKDEIMKKYRSWEIDYYTANWIVSNFNKYIYHSNKVFNYISIKEIRKDIPEVDTAIKKNYELSRSYYKRVKYLILKKS